MIYSKAFPMNSIENNKERIADKYLENFKSDLKFFEKMMIMPIEKKMKDILKSDKEINVDNLEDLTDLGFRRKILGIQIGDKKLFENLVNKIFSFLKEKQEKILKAQTTGRLDELLNLVINGKLGELETVINLTDNSDVKNKDSDARNNNSTNNYTNGYNNLYSTISHNQNDHMDNEEDGNILENNPIATGVAAGAVAGGLQIGTTQAIEHLTGLTGAPEIKTFNAEQTKTLLENVNGKLEEQLTNPKINTSMRKTYEKTIKNFNDTIDSLDKEGAKAFQDLQNLGNRMPSNILETLKVNNKILSAIDKIPDNELITIIGKDEKFIIEFFKGKGIEISEDFAKQLKIAKNIPELKGIVNVFRNSTKLCKIVKGIKGMGVLTFLLAGVDVRCYLETKKESELVAKINDLRGKIIKDEATAQLWIGLGSVIAELAAIVGICVAGGSVVGPIGTAVGLAIGIVTATLSIGIDTLYYNKKEFYAQNRYDFINQSRTQIKQSIVQLLESDRLNMNEKMKESIKNGRGENPEIDTLEDAWEALIYQEEFVNGGFYILNSYYNSGESEKIFLSKLSEQEIQQYNNEKNQMESKIRARMDYIKTYIKKDDKSEGYNLMKQFIANNKGISFVEQVLANSKVYEYIQTEDNESYVKNCKILTVAEYKTSYKENLIKEYPTEFKLFERLKKESPMILHEICLGSEYSKSSIEQGIEEGYYDDCKDQIQHNLDFILKYSKYINLGLPLEKQMQDYGMDNNMDFNYIEQVLKDISTINKRPIRNKETTYKYLTHESYKERQNLKYEVSEDINQNILYRLAKEFHGYTGRNDLLELIQFYNEGEGNNTGIYYDNKWKINRDWDRDTPLDFNDIENILDNKDWSRSAWLFIPTYKKGIDRIDLDSSIEAADKKIIEEYKDKLKSIIKEEKSHKGKKKEIENDIIGYIKNQSNGTEGYIELPYDMIIKAKKSGIGKTENYVFSYKNGQIIALCTGDNSTEILDFSLSNTNISYATLEPLRKSLSIEAQNLIKSVDEAHSKLEILRSIEGDGTNIFGNNHIDELDIPIELERTMSEKWKERENIKEAILYMQPYSAQAYLSEKSKEYFNYFDGIYRGILNTISNYSSSNDLNESPDFFRAYYWTNQFSIVDIKDGSFSISPNINSAIASVLPELFDYYKDKDGKSVFDLLRGDNSQAYGQELAKQIYTICLEESLFQYNSDGKLGDFGVKIKKDKHIPLDTIKSKLNSRMKEFTFHKNHKQYNDTQSEPQTNKFSIKTSHNIEKKIHLDINYMTNNIINTLNNVDWAGKRGEPKFILEGEPTNNKLSGYLESRGYKEKISIQIDNSGKNIESININGINSIKFIDIQEGFRVANLINRLKDYKQKNPRGTKISGRGIASQFGNFIRSNGKLQREIINGIDIDILDKDTVKKYYQGILNNNSFIGYINGL